MASCPFLVLLPVFNTKIKTGQGFFYIDAAFF